MEKKRYALLISHRSSSRLPSSVPRIPRIRSLHTLKQQSRTFLWTYRDYGEQTPPAIIFYTLHPLTSAISAWLLVNNRWPLMMIRTRQDTSWHSNSQTTEVQRLTGPSLTTQLQRCIVLIVLLLVVQFFFFLQINQSDSLIISDCIPPGCLSVIWTGTYPCTTGRLSIDTLP